MIKCNSCGIEKDESFFSKRKLNPSKYYNKCASCKSIYLKEYNLKNIDKIKAERKAIYAHNRTLILEKNKVSREKYRNKIIEGQKKYYLLNKEKIKIINKKYSDLNKEKIRIRKKAYALKNKVIIREKTRVHIAKRRINDPKYRITKDIRRLILISFTRKGYTKRSKTHQFLGCDFEFFKNHIENLFTENMSWENRSEWHIDHIYPISLAKNEDEVIKLNHYTNLRPLWAKENIAKGNKIISLT